MPTRRPLIACALALVCAASAHHLLSAAEHTGQVTFAGGPVPGVSVTASQGDWQVTTTTDREGVYRFDHLEDGVWTLRVEMRGFAPATREVTVAADAPGQDPWDLAILSFDEIARAGTTVARLPPADRPAPLRPAPAAPQPPSTPAAGATRTPAPAAQPPSPPGAARTTPAATVSTAATAAVAIEEEAPANPLFGAADSFLVNGSVMNAAASPFSQSRAIGTARVQLTRTPYRVTTSLGGRSSVLDARPVGVSVRPDNHNLNFAASLSGPLRIPGLVRNGPQFTVSVGRSDTYTADSSSLRLPTALERRGDFSQTVDGFGRPVQIIDPATGTPFPGNAIPPERVSAEALALLAYYPRTSGGLDARTNFQAASIRGGHTDNVSFRLNTFAIGRQSLIEGVTVGYSRGLSETTTPFAFEDLGRSSSVNAAIAFSHRISPFIVLRARNTASRSTSRTEPYFAHRANVSGLAGVTGNNQDPEHWGPPALTFRTIDPLRTTDHARSQRMTNLSVVETNWSYRRHALVFGGEVERRWTDLVSQQNPRGTFFFSGDHTGSDIADFLLGLPQTSTIAFGNADKYLRQSTYALFLTDDFRVSPSFTMNLGVRWEYEGPVTEAQDRLVNLDVAPGFAAVSPVLASDPVGALTGRTYPASLVRPDRGGIQPRLAIAWRPFLGSSVIVRAGYGIYRNTNVYEAIALQLAQQPPLSLAASAARSEETPITLANGFAASPAITQNTWAIDPDFRVGYAHNWQALIQRDFPWALQIAATYVGVKGSRLPQVFLPNTWAPGSENPCPACPVGFRYLTSGGSSSVHRGQVQVRRRLRNNIEASTQYTLSTGTDNASAFVGIGGGVAQNWQDLEAERGPSALIARHQVGGQFTYSSTIGIGRRGWRGPLLGGWVVATNVNMTSGSPLTPMYAAAVPGTAIAGTVRPSLTGEPLSAVAEGYYLNPAAFAPPAPGEWGNARRGMVRGPRTFSLNATLSRAFRIGPQRTLTWQMSASNVLNQVTHAGVNMSVGSPQFGLPTGFTQPRRLTMNLRMQF